MLFKYIIEKRGGGGNPSITTDSIESKTHSATLSHNTKYIDFKENIESNPKDSKPPKNIFSRIVYRIRFWRKLIKSSIFFNRYVQIGPGCVSTGRFMKEIPFGYMPSKYKTRSPFAFLMPFKYKNQGLLCYLYQKLQKLEEKYNKIDKLHNYLIKKYIKLRLLFGKVDIPYIEVVLTLKCTMRCESCCVMVPYFDSKNQYTCSTSHIIESLQAMLKKVDSIRLVRLLGGEPLLYSDIINVVKFLDSEPKIKAFNIVTNGTIIPSIALLDTLKDTHKAMFYISDYTRSPNLKIPLKHKEIINLLKSYNIRYWFTWQNDDLWVDGGKKYKRNRSKEDIINNFRNCMLRCVSLMSVDSGDKSVDTQSLAPKGAVFVCPIASSLSRLKGLGEFEGDFIDLANAPKDRYLEFYAQDFYKACDYCPDMKNGWWNGKRVAVAVQTQNTFKVP